ncbi:hypothetical protein BGZ46_002760 [Entomortierella lignicola]|nr:hypothetical protein BGZ46_002760 [Entomortierella lignicola]
MALSQGMGEDRLSRPNGTKIPNRVNYICWIEDLMYLDFENLIHGIDIGTGASCIYPLLGCARNKNWRFVATDIDDRSIQFASKNIERNNLENVITIIKNISQQIFASDLFTNVDRKYHFCMCNPPFYEDENEIKESFEAKIELPSAICKGTSNEMMTVGGEVQFVKQMIDESLQLQTRIRWYTSMLGKKSSVDKIIDHFKECNIPNYTLTTFHQGRTTRWGVAWSFGQEHAPTIDQEPTNTTSAGNESTQKIIKGRAKANTWSRAARRALARKPDSGVKENRENKEIPDIMGFSLRVLPNITNHEPKCSKSEVETGSLPSDGLTMVQTTHARALFDCVGDEESELTFRDGDILVDVKPTSEEGWLHGRLERTGEEGLFPDNYVEIIQVEVEAPPSAPKLSAPPQLPVRSPVNSAKNTTSVPARPIRPDSSTLNTTVTKPLLPTRNDQVSLTTGVRNIALSESPIKISGFDKSDVKSAKVILPGMGTKSMYDSVSSQTQLDLGRALSGPPALPKRSKTLQENTSESSNDQTNTVALSVRDRMANLSIANQRQVNTPSNPSSIAQPAPLPPRPTTVHSSLSSAARPALPPRTETLSESSSPSLSAIDTKKHVYQVQDAAVPVPKLTTFARPRSARTGKSPMPTQKETSPGTSLVGGISPPKLPNRPASTLTASNSTPAGTTADSSSTGPVRFSPAALKQGSSILNSALPTISRNAQPLALPSRTNVSPIPASSATKIVQDSPKATPETFRISGLPLNNIIEDSNVQAGSAFGVKLNSVGSRSISAPPTPAADPLVAESTKSAAPPLPARSSTVSSSPSVVSGGSTASSMKLQRDANLRPFSTSTLSFAQPNKDHQPVTNNSNYTSHKPPQFFEQQMMSVKGAWSNVSQSPKPNSGTRVAMPPPRLPETIAPETMGVKPNARKRYEMLFQSLTTEDYIEGAKVHAVYVRSRLDSKTLAQIWDMVDVDNSGRLNRAQFCMGLYLIDERLASGLIPLEVSDELWSLIVRSSNGMAMIARQQLQQQQQHQRIFMARRSPLLAFQIQQQERMFTSPSRISFAASADVDKGVQAITDLFMTARDELEYAEEARGTVYYNDDKEAAREAVQECLTTYDTLLLDLDEAQKLDVQRKIGLKIMELKSQLDSLNAEELE